MKLLRIILYRYSRTRKIQSFNKYLFKKSRWSNFSFRYNWKRNFLDLNDKRAVNKEEGQKLASNLNCKYIEVSAKTGEKIDEAFDEISTETYQKYKKSGKRNTSFFLKNSKKQNKHKTKDKKKEIDCCSSDVWYHIIKYI